MHMPRPCKWEIMIIFLTCATFLSYLCQGDVASVRERGDHQTVGASQVLVLVIKVHISDCNHHLLQVRFEVEPEDKLK